MFMVNLRAPEAPSRIEAPAASIEVTSSLLTKNWLLNLGGQILPLALGLLTIPYLLRGLGAERFGILSIAWVLLGYFGLFDFGLGRATTKFVAECLGRGESEKLAGIVWTSLVSQVIFGVGGGFLAGLAIPVLVNHLLKVSPLLIAETKSSFYILALSLPIVLATNSLRGVLEAAQKFDVVNYIKVPANASVFILPVLALPLGFGLPGIVGLLVLARIAATLAYLLACLSAFPLLRQKPSFHSKMLRPLFVFGGWVTVSNIVAPLLIYMDRFFIGSTLSMVAVGYYTAPYEAITRAWVFPASLIATLFPAFTTLDASGSTSRLQQLYVMSLNSLLLSLGPLMLLVIAFSRDILRLWIGAEFARQSTLVLQILAVGVLLNSLAFVPFGLLQAMGRPDLTAKFHLLELPFYGLALWLMLARFGLPGAAVAWSLRALLDTLLLFLAVGRLQWIPARALFSHSIGRTFVSLAVLGILFFLSSWLFHDLFLQVCFSFFSLALFVVGVWIFVLEETEKGALRSISTRFGAVFGEGI